MRVFLLNVFVLCLLFACKSNGGGSVSSGRGGSSGSAGQIGTRGSTKNFTPIRPYGMIPIPSGEFVLGQTDFNYTDSQDAPARTVTVQGFFMDETEVVNAEYRDFVRYVKDSIARHALAEKVQELGVAGEDGIGEYAFLGADPKGKISPYQEYIESITNERDGGYDSYNRINWDIPLYWSVEDYPDVAYAEVMEGLYYPPDQRFNGSREIDVRNLNYRYTWIDTQSAAKKGNGNRSIFMITEEFNIYPDTTVWSRDFKYAYNEPIHEYYFWHHSYDLYPVVGVRWDQANAYCNYKTNKHNEFLAKKKNSEKILAYRLPTEIEWEYAARGGLEAAPYPWGGPYLTDDRGCYLANFKPKRGGYIENCGKKGGFLYTGTVKTYPPNGFGLYDMAGNVSEWTSSAYESSFYNVAAGLNPSQSSSASKPVKVVRGGSWKDFGFLLQVSNRDYEHKDSARSFIGFRTVQTIPEGSVLRYPTIAN